MKKVLPILCQHAKASQGLKQSPLSSLIFSFILKTKRFNEADEFKFEDWDAFLQCIQDHLFKKAIKEEKKDGDGGEDSEEEQLM